ncbi:hypothetical protein ACGK9U_13310 [Mariniflexile sp. HNIBRBA6329]|uniref:hypothetical protein n=1 Tax=Mariniflexile sp. HNIBRBA6329 TaxID=3373088 RepID=UPI00374668D7
MNFINLGPIGTKEDGDLKGAFHLNGNHFMIHENAIYEIEPIENVKQSNLPKFIHRLIINQGTNHPIVGQTIFQALQLVKSNFIDSKIDKSQLLNISLEILQEAKVLEQEVESYCALEKKLIQTDIENKGNSIPSIRDVTTRCKTVFQKAHHIQLLINNIILLFYPKLIDYKADYKTFLINVSEINPTDSVLFEKIKSWSTSMNLIREMRNKLDHLNTNQVSVKDFYFDSEKDPRGLYIMRPSIKLDSKKAKLTRTDLSKVFPNTIYTIISVYQDTLAFLINENLPADLNLTVNEIPEAERENKWVKYGFLSAQGKVYI